MMNFRKFFVVFLSVILFASCNDDDIKEKNKNKKPLKTDLAPTGGDGGDGTGDNASIIGDRTLITDPKQIFLQSSIIVNKGTVHKTHFIYGFEEENGMALKSENLTSLTVNSQGNLLLEIFLASNVWHKLLMDKKFLGTEWDYYLYEDGQKPEDSKRFSHPLHKPTPVQWKVLENDQNIFYYQYGLEMGDVKAREDTIKAQGYHIALQALTILLQDSEDPKSPVIYMTIPLNVQ